MIRDKPTQYYLPKKWVEYLSYQPEMGMGYQVADIYLKGKKLKNIIILGCLTFNHKNKKLDLDNIEKIVVKEKKFQTVSVKNTPTKEAKMTNYYLIEEYTEYDDRPGGSTWKAYDVQSFTTADQLKDAILKGSKHGGKLIPTKGLELKLQIIEDEQDRNEGLRQDMKRREEAYRKTGDILDDCRRIREHYR